MPATALSPAALLFAVTSAKGVGASVDTGAKKDVLGGLGEAIKPSAANDPDTASAGGAEQAFAQALASAMVVAAPSQPVASAPVKAQGGSRAASAPVANGGFKVANAAVVASSSVAAPPASNGNGLASFETLPSVAPQDDGKGGAAKVKVAASAAAPVAKAQGRAIPDPATPQTTVKATGPAPVAAKATAPASIEARPSATP